MNESHQLFIEQKNGSSSRTACRETAAVTTYLAAGPFLGPSAALYDCSKSTMYAYEEYDTCDYIESSLESVAHAPRALNEVGKRFEIP